MNTLDYVVRVYESSPDTVTLMIPHSPPRWHNKAKDIESQDKTREFCAWIRKTYKHLESEYKFVNRERVVDYSRRYHRGYKIVNKEKHYCVYGLSKSEYLMIKLSWSFTWQEAHYKAAQYLSLSERENDGKYFFCVFDGPSSALKQRTRMKEYNARRKALLAEEKKKVKQEKSSDE